MRKQVCFSFFLPPNPFITTFATPMNFISSVLNAPMPLHLLYPLKRKLHLHHVYLCCFSIPCLMAICHYQRASSIWRLSFIPSLSNRLIRFFPLLPVSSSTALQSSPSAHHLSPSQPSVLALNHLFKFLLCCSITEN